MWSDKGSGPSRCRTEESCSLQTLVTLTLSLILVGVGIQGRTTSLEGEQGMPPRSHSASAQRQQKDGTVASGAKSSATGKHPRRYWQDMTTEDFAALEGMSRRMLNLNLG